MKIAVLTSQERCETYTDKSMVPHGTQLIYFGQAYDEEHIITEAGDAECIIVDAISPISANLINGMANLKLIHSEGVGFNAINLEAAREKGVYVCNNRAVNAGQVAEHAVLLMLAVLRRFSEGQEMVWSGRQMEAKSSFIMAGLSDLTGRKVGLVGFGAIARELAKRLVPFGCELFYFSRTPASEQEEKEFGVKYLPRDELFRQCHIISLHVPVTPETENMICANTLSMMKPEAILINTSRGAIVNTQDLACAIKQGTIWGAGLDTIEPEPVPADSPLVTLPAPYKYRVALSPHIAGTTKSVFFASYKTIWNNIASISKGQRPINIVNQL